MSLFEWAANVSLPEGTFNMIRNTIYAFFSLFHKNLELDEN